MSKRQDLFKQLEDLDPFDPKRKEIQKKINEIEEYCIKKGWLQSITKWESFEVSDNYPWHCGAIWFDDISLVGELNNKGINYNYDETIHVCQDCNNLSG